MIYYTHCKETLTHEEQRSAAHRLLLEGIKREYGLTTLPAMVSQEGGKPYFPAHPEICFNYSHSRGRIACALAGTPVGIDLERIRPFREKTALRFCHEREWQWLLKQRDPDSAWIRIWTIKEAYAKYTGLGLRLQMSRLDFSDVLTETGSIRRFDPETDSSAVYFLSQEIGAYWLTVCAGCEEALYNPIILC